MSEKKRVHRDLSAEKILAAFDEKRYVIVAFEGTVRVMTIGNCNLVRMSQEVLERSARGQLLLVFEAGKVPVSDIEWNLNVWLEAVKPGWMGR